MKVLVLGATGHIGNAFVREFLHQRQHVTAISRRKESPANLISENATIQPKINVKEFADLIRSKKVLNNPKLDRKTIIAEGDRIAVEVDSKDKFTNPDGTPFLTDVRYGIHCEVRDSKIMKMAFFMSGMCWPCPVPCAIRPCP
jgi:NAD(P)-dependent dehydrogenase (short-subunit alcohol dehydrogenase family)